MKENEGFAEWVRCLKDEVLKNDFAMNSLGYLRSGRIEFYEEKNYRL